MFRNHDPRIKVFVFGIILLMIVLLYITKVLSDSFLYKYLKNIKTKFTQNLLVGFHWLSSVVLALILPDFLAKFSFIKEVFESSQVWEYLATLCVFFVGLIVIGTILNLVLWKSFAEENRERKL